MTNCIANKKQYGIILKCVKPHEHKGNHKWKKDENYYPFGRLDPDNLFDQALVNAFNKGIKNAN